MLNSQRVLIFQTSGITIRGTARGKHSQFHSIQLSSVQPPGLKMLNGLCHNHQHTHTYTHTYIFIYLRIFIYHNTIYSMMLLLISKLDRNYIYIYSITPILSSNNRGKYCSHAFQPLLPSASTPGVNDRRSGRCFFLVPKKLRTCWKWVFICPNIVH